MIRRRKSLATACAIVLASIPAHAFAARIDYSADVGIERNDNVLMEAQDPQSSDALRAGVGFLFTEDTSNLQANVGGRFEYWNYVGGPQSNAFETTLSGRLNWFFVPEVMSFTIENNLDMRPIDRFVPNTSDNRQRVNVLSLGPNVHFNWSQAFRGRFELRWIDSSAEIADEFESERISAAMHLLRDIDATSSVSLSLRAQDVDFDHDTAIRDDEPMRVRDYRRYDAYARYQKELARLGFSFDVGHTWIDFVDGSSSTSPMLRGNAHWTLSPSSTLQLGVIHQLSDAASDAIEGVGTAQTVPEGLVNGAASVSTSLYEDNRAELIYVFQRDRFGLTFGPYYDRIEYLDELTEDETRRGGLVQVNYRLAPTWQMTAFHDVSRSSFPDVDRRVEDTRSGLSVEKTWSRHWSSNLVYARYGRNDSGPVGDSRQNIWYLTLRYRNR